MIYIFQGCQNVCSLPGLACKACGNACAKCNCSWAQDACTACGSCVTHFFERPLSTFVLVALVMSGLSAYTSVLAMDPDEAKKCNFTGVIEGSTWIMIQLAVAAIFFVFSIYLQIKVFKVIKDLVSANPNETTEDATAGGDVEKVKVKKDTVQQAFKITFMEDFFVLIVFVMLAVNAGLAFQSDAGKACAGLMAPYSVIMPKVMFGVCFLYSLAYYCCTCCANTLVIEKTEAYGSLEQGLVE